MKSNQPTFSRNFFGMEPTKSLDTTQFREKRLCEVIAVHSKSFHAASLLLPKRVRTDARIIYAWFRFCDDTFDEKDCAGQRELDQLSSKLDMIYSAKLSNKVPLISAMSRIVKEYSIPRYYFDELLLGMATDTKMPRFKSHEELMRYCFQVASTVGLVMTHLLKVESDKQLVGAAHLGIAMQLTNICRDIKEDFLMGRRYLPGNLSDPSEVWPPKDLQDFMKITTDLLRTAETYYDSASKHIESLPLDVRASIRSALQIYRAIGRKIITGQVDPTSNRSRTNALTKIAFSACNFIRYKMKSLFRKEQKLYISPGSTLHFSKLILLPPIKS